MRTTVLLICLIALPALRADADERVKARVEVGESGVTLVEGASRRRVSGSLTGTLRHFAGREVEVELSSTNAVTRVVSPARTELRGSIDQGTFGERDGRRVKLFGPAASLVPAGRVCVLDAWVFESEACVVAVEGRTTDAWNLVHMFSSWRSPVDVIRGRRPVWVSERSDGRVHVRRGDTAGWVDEASVTLGEAPVHGLVDAIPR